MIFLSHSFNVNLTTQWDIPSDLDRQIRISLKWQGAVICVVSPGISTRAAASVLFNRERLDVDGILALEHTHALDGRGCYLFKVYFLP